VKLKGTRGGERGFASRESTHTERTSKRITSLVSRTEGEKDETGKGLSREGTPHRLGNAPNEEENLYKSMPAHISDTPEGENVPLSVRED